MKKSLIIGIAAGLLMVPLAMNVTSGETATEPPPMEQALVREGDLAIKLVDRLKIGTAENEAEAESMLVSSGIALRNGWIADYPITPDIIGELQDAIGEAVDSQRLAMGKDEALRQFQDLAAEMGLSFVADTRGEVATDESPRDYGEYSRPEVINNYYYNEGPPVVTYYPPPWDYDYMYSWVPYPFWCSGFWFPGFFVLHDFHRTIFVHGRICSVSNHFRDPRTHRVFTIDPVTRHAGRKFRADLDTSRRRGFPSNEARSGATSIFDRSRERSRPGHPVLTRPQAGLADRNRISPSSTVRAKKPISNGRREGKTATFDSQNGNQARLPIIPRGMRRSPAETGPRDVSERRLSRQRSVESRGMTAAGGSAERIQRSFRAPSNGSRRSFEVPRGDSRSGGLGTGILIRGR